MFWNGGMSFHGGLLGVIIATMIFGKKNSQNPFKILDLISIAANWNFLWKDCKFYKF